MTNRGCQCFGNRTNWQGKPKQWQTSAVWVHSLNPPICNTPSLLRHAHTLCDKVTAQCLIVTADKMPVLLTQVYTCWVRQLETAAASGFGLAKIWYWSRSVLPDLGQKWAGSASGWSGVTSPWWAHCCREGVNILSDERGFSASPWRNEWPPRNHKHCSLMQPGAFKVNDSHAHALLSTGASLKNSLQARRATPENPLKIVYKRDIPGHRPHKWPPSLNVYLSPPLTLHKPKESTRHKTTTSVPVMPQTWASPGSSNSAQLLCSAGPLSTPTLHKRAWQ